MSGIDIRLGKLFNGKKNLVISAIDHVVEYGDQEGIETSAIAIKKCLKTDALLLSRYSLLRNSEFFANKTSPIPVVRVNWTSGFYYPLEYKQGYTTIAADVERAVEAGAEMVICSLFLEIGDEKQETKNVEIFSEAVRQKEKLGIPLIGEVYVIEHKSLTQEQLHLKVKRVARVMAELGADIIKAFYTYKFNEVVENTPVPVFVIGAEKLSNDLAVLEKAEKSVKMGARGIIFGRNIFMAKEPEKIIAALNEVLNSGISAEKAALKYGLT